MKTEDYGYDELQVLADSTTKFPSLADIKHKLTTREGWIGDFDFKNLFMPTLNPWSKKPENRRETPFYGLNDNLPIVIGLICGFQHSLAMLAGVITPPIIISSQIGLPAETRVYMVSASLIACGILSAVQMTRFKIPFTNVYFGTGLITVVGTSFATLSTASGIFNALYKSGTCPMVLSSDGITTVRGACPEAFGYLLGTAALASLLEIGMAFIPPKTLRRIFPPHITGMVVLLIGTSLIGESGFLNWAGGSGTCHSRPETGRFALCPYVGAPNAAPWGSAQFLGLGFLSFLTIILVELFGSPFMRNASIVIGLAVGMIVAGAAGYVEDSNIKAAPAITFLWTTTFPLKLYAPAIIPCMAVYVALAMEAMGDITASSEASRQPVSGLLYDSRVAGGILADGVNGMLSCLATNTPLSIFAQNNGVISLTRCANRSAGYYCCGFIVTYGILAKISGAFLSIPAPVLGGVTTFLFATVVTSGLKVISYVPMTRRNRIVLASGLCFGLGNIVVDDWFAYAFTYDGPNEALVGFINSIEVIVSTPFLSGAIVSIIINLILPSDEESEPKPAACAPEPVDIVDQRHTLERTQSLSNSEEKGDKLDRIEPA